MPTRRRWKPKWSEPCPCASGNKFKDCCWRCLPDFDIGKAYFQAIKENRFDRALVATRADITQYTIWHKTNTAPVIARSGAVSKLLRIDVNALGDYVSRLSWLYFRLELWKDWPAVLERLRSNIQHPSWYKRITYHLAFHYLGPGGDRGKARQELAKAGPITKKEDDLELLRLYGDLEFDDLPFAARIEILDRILELDDDRENQLQYRGAKAVQYFMIGDAQTAEQQLSDALAMVQQTEKDDPLEGYEKHIYCRLLQLKGSVRHDKQILKASALEFQALLLEPNWTRSGKANIHREICNSYRYAGEWDQAETASREAIALDGSQLDKVHLAECLLYLKDTDAAASEIDAVERETLPHHEFEDFVFAYSAIAIWSNKAERLTEAKTLLQGLGTADPIFNDRRLNLLLRVTETLASGNASAAAKNDSTPTGGVATASSFFLLQPTLAGLGIDFSEVLEYMARKTPKDTPDGLD
ncbi:SEC-C domain-containing protein [Bradyrhizobium septentrionale]|uniref:SEC-C domain-containing protein n=1 Tax=Bradyrhizobium septentrionale TaxID=1404411 RepID=A0A974A5J4_9BRAD|nr:SEC-C domain-containing protein [Bradyrhizobium septentrionale]UGY17938.1 SEC-C domain-containing protein [Bradyrhizobium septentrionale]